MLKRAVIEGIKNIIRSFWLSATAISVLTVSLTSVAMVATLSTVVGFAVRNIDQLVSISAFLKEDFPEDKINNLVKKVEEIPNVKKVEYFNKDKAKEELEKGNNKINFDFIKSQTKDQGNLVWRFILITPENSESYGSVISTLKSGDFLDGTDLPDAWEEVPGDQEFVNNLIRFNSWVRIVGVVLILVFAAISILVMVNILRITIYSHKDEIEIMRLVGATNKYIRAPFIAEGIYYNVIAAVVVTALFIPGFNIILPGLSSWLGGDITANSANLILQMYLIFSATIVSGILIGVITTYVATQKYLSL